MEPSAPNQPSSPPRDHHTTRHRVFSWAVGVALIGAVMMPPFRDPPIDSFPLSTYPMFSTKRERAVLDQAVGLNAAGESRPLPPGAVASGEVMQAAMTLRRAARGGRKTSARLCREVAERLTSIDDLDDIERVQIISALWDPVAFFAVDDPKPLESKVRAECEVTR